jgi:succinate dehydrogenase hydrophobic anchor subunit
MTMMAATAVAVLILSVVMVPVTVMKPKHHVQKTAVQVELVQTVNLIGQLTALNAVIQHGVSMVLTVQH